MLSVVSHTARSHRKNGFAFGKDTLLVLARKKFSFYICEHQLEYISIFTRKAWHNFENTLLISSFLQTSGTCKWDYMVNTVRCPPSFIWCMFVYVYAHVCVCICVLICQPRSFLYVFVCTCTCVCMHECMFVYMYAYNLEERPNMFGAVPEKVDKYLWECMHMCI